jgi:hypothetical protein
VIGQPLDALQAMSCRLRNSVDAVSTRPADNAQVRDLGMFNLGIGSKLRGCNLVSLRVEDVVAQELAADQAMANAQSKNA